MSCCNHILLQQKSTHLCKQTKGAKNRRQAGEEYQRTVGCAISGPTQDCRAACVEEGQACETPSHVSHSSSTIEQAIAKPSVDGLVVARRFTLELVDDPAPADVQHPGGPLHPREFRRSDQVPRLRGERDVHREEVHVRQERVQPRRGVDAEVADLERFLGRSLTVALDPPV